MILKSLNISHAGLFLVMVILVFDTSAIAQGEKKFIRQGNKAFGHGEFKEAEIDYQKALEKNRQSEIGEFNLGGALFKQDNFEESATLFNNASRRNLPEQQRAGAFHNLGNSMVQLQQFEQAVEAYKNALRLNPDDLDTKYNLLYAQQMLRQQQEQQQDQQDQNDQQDQQDQQDKQDQAQNQDQEKQQDQQQQDSQQKDSQQDQQQQAQSQPKQISKEDAERMLQALQEREKRTMEKLKMEEFKNAKRVTTEKDW
jgi:Ca-activated chloride channel homolog